MDIEEMKRILSSEKREYINEKAQRDVSNDEYDPPYPLPSNEEYVIASNLFYKYCWRACKDNE